jgi:TolB protein
MFGDLPNTQPATYFSRSTVSLKQLTFSQIGADFDPDIDSSGRWLVFVSTRHNVQPDLYMKSLDGVAVTQLTSDPESDVQPAFSPDGARVAFASNRSGNWDIWTVSVAGGPPVQITDGPADELHPSWSPDGTSLVYCSLPSHGGQWELWITSAQAGSPRRFIGYGLFPDWSPTKDVILFQRARGRGSHWFSVWTLTLIDGEPRYPTELAAAPGEAMMLPSWSPDGHHIAFTGASMVPVDSAGVGLPDRLALADIWVMDADGRGKVRLTDGHTSNYSPVFGPDGHLFFTSNRSGHDNVWALSPLGYRRGQLEAGAQTAESERLHTPPEPKATTVSARDGL